MTFRVAGPQRMLAMNEPPNPYQSPNQPIVNFTRDGADGPRLNRLNYFLLSLAIGVPSQIIVAIFSGNPSEGPSPAALPVVFLVAIVSMVLHVMILRRRLRDIGEDPNTWWKILIPIYNFGFGLWVLFTPSDSSFGS
jgi:hypothetical protein